MYSCSFAGSLEHLTGKSIALKPEVFLAKTSPCNLQGSFGLVPGQNGPLGELLWRFLPLATASLHSDPRASDPDLDRSKVTRKRSCQNDTRQALTLRFATPALFACSLDHPPAASRKATNVRGSDAIACTDLATGTALRSGIRDFQEYPY